MARYPSTPLRNASKPRELSDQEWPALLRSLVDDMQALCELAVVVDELEAEVLCASPPPSTKNVPRLLKLPSPAAVRFH